MNYLAYFISKNYFQNCNIINQDELTYFYWYLNVFSGGGRHTDGTHDW